MLSSTEMNKQKRVAVKKWLNAAVVQVQVVIT